MHIYYVEYIILLWMHISPVGKRLPTTIIIQIYSYVRTCTWEEEAERNMTHRDFAAFVFKFNYISVCMAFLSLYFSFLFILFSFLLSESGTFAHIHSHRIKKAIKFNYMHFEENNTPLCAHIHANVIRC